MVRLFAGYNYQNGELITENMPADGILLFDLNAQGIVDISPHLNRFKLAFPKVYANYMRKLKKDELTPGDVYFDREEDYLVAILITAGNVIGKNKDSNEDIEAATTLAIEELVKRCEHGEVILSGIVNRYSGMWDKSKQIMTHEFKKKNIKWTIYNK